MIAANFAAIAWYDAQNPDRGGPVARDMARVARTARVDGLFNLKAKSA
jgi:hypothetical protein